MALSGDVSGMFKDWRFSIAFRLFGAGSRHRLMSFIGLLSISGLTLAVAVLVTVLSVVNGFERELLTRVLGVLPHGIVYVQDADFDWRSLRLRVLQHPDIEAAAPIVEGAGLVIAGGELAGVGIRGVDPMLEPSVSILPEFMESGSFESLADESYGVVIGAELAERLGVLVGDGLTLVLPQVAFSIAGPVVTTRRLKVTGIFRMGADQDKEQIILNIRDALRLKRQGAVNSIAIKTNDLFEAPRILHELGLEEGNLYGMSWMRRNGNLYEAIRTQKTTLFLLLLILVVVAAFNLISNLVMTVDDNRSSIAILRTLGASPTDIRFIFAVHGLAVGMIGLASGILLGLLLTSMVSVLFSSVTSFFGLNLMQAYFIRYLPTEVQLTDIAAIASISLLICGLMTIYPASRAASANPVETLRHEV